MGTIQRDSSAQRLTCHTATGSGAMAETVAPGVGARLVSVVVTVGVAAATAENFTVTRTKTGLAALSEKALVQAMASQTSVRWQPTDCWLFAEDSLALAWTNTDARTWALEVTYET